MRRWAQAASVGVLAVGVLVLSGCGQPRTADAVLSRARAQLEQGDRAATVRTLSAALRNTRLQSEQPRVLQGGLELLLAADALAEAQQVWLAAVRTGDAALGSAGFDRIVASFTQASRWRDLVDWCDSLGAGGLPAELVLRARLAAVQALVKLGDFDGAVARVPELLAGEPTDDLRGVLTGLCDWLQAGQATNQVERLFADLRTAGDSRPAWRVLAGALAVRVAVQKKEWEAARSALDALILLGDASSSSAALGSMVHALVAAGEESRAGALCGDMVAQNRHPNLAATALRGWLEQARRMRQPEEIPARLARADAAGVAMPVMLPAYRDYVYDVLGPAPTNAVRELHELGYRLVARCDQPGQKESIQSLRFDVAFVAGDYRRVLQLLDEGIPGHDADWLAMARNKVLAHQALQEGNLEDAVARFRDFMAFVDKTWQASESDPSTGLNHTKEMTLGFNARRIGDILQQAGSASDAAVAYAEARGYYTKALQSLPAASREYNLASNELARIPGN